MGQGLKKPNLTANLVLILNGGSDRKRSTEPAFVTKVTSVTLSGRGFKKVSVVIVHQLQHSNKSLPEGRISLAMYSCNLDWEGVKGVVRFRQ